MPSDRQLLILGNGFNLQCGLESNLKNFADTMDARIHDSLHLYKNEHTVITGATVRLGNGSKKDASGISSWLLSNGLTVWDSILKKDDPRKTWSAAEDCIRNVVDFRSASEGSSKKSLVEQVYQDNKKQESENAIKAAGPVTEDFVKHLFSNPSQCLLTYAHQIYEWDGQKDHLLDILLDQLHCYEQRLAEYLAKQEHNKSYQRKAVHLLENLANDAAPECVEENDGAQNQYQGYTKSMHILNFNYTNFKSITDACSQKSHATTQFTCHNIHGLASRGNIIFGIGDTGLNPKPSYHEKIVKFTKAYRILALYNSFPQSPLLTYDAGSQNSQIDVIKFYGHSLDEADYPYFQLIFDAVDLYASNTRLIFYYHETCPDDQVQKAREEMLEKVNRLITAYGQSLSDTNKGRYLPYKLILEDRLILRQMP